MATRSFAAETASSLLFDFSDILVPTDEPSERRVMGSLIRGLLVERSVFMEIFFGKLSPFSHKISVLISAVRGSSPS